MLRSVCLAFVLATASIAVWAQSTPAPADAAITAAAAAEQKVGKLAAQRTQLNQRYQQELTDIDKLTNEKASWRRDREIRELKANAKDTADQLAAVTRLLGAGQDALATARRAELAALDAELPTATGPRAQRLTKLRGQLVAQGGAAPNKIVIPNCDDPLADPDELEQCAAALDDSARQLERQVAGLDQQAKDLTGVADLRKQHDRAIELNTRDDDQPHRGVQPSARGDGQTSVPSPPGNGIGGAGGGSGSGAGEGPPVTFGNDRTPTTFEAEAVVLGEVIDQSTIASLVKASRSGDPATRAEAAKLARDAVQRRLDQLKKKREQIGLRAKQLRAKP